MKKDEKLKIKNLKKIKSLIIKNSSVVDKILVSEQFLNQLIKYAEYVDVELSDSEDLFLFDKPVQLSRFIYEGCILILKNEEYIVLKGI